MRLDDTAAAEVDSNNSVESDGQDWFVAVQDAERDDEDHLCGTASVIDGYNCSSIRCVARRPMKTNDSYDF